MKGCLTFLFSLCLGTECLGAPIMKFGPLWKEGASLTATGTTNALIQRSPNLREWSSGLNVFSKSESWTSGEYFEFRPGETIRFYRAVNQTQLIVEMRARWSNAGIRDYE